MKKKVLVNVNKVNTTYTHDFLIKCFFNGHNIWLLELELIFFYKNQLSFQAEQVLKILGIN